MLTRELIVAAGNQGGDATQFTSIINAVFGTRMRMITGYPGGNDMLLAMERGEVQGRCGWSWSSVKASRPSWIADKSINILLQMALSKHPELPDVPFILDLARTDEQRNILKLIFARQESAYPFLAPPDVSPHRAETLRKAFMDTMTDKDFLAEAAKTQLEINPVSGEEVEKLVRMMRISFNQFAFASQQEPGAESYKGAIAAWKRIEEEAKPVLTALRVV